MHPPWRQAGAENSEAFSPCLCGSAGLCLVTTFAKQVMSSRSAFGGGILGKAGSTDAPGSAGPICGIGGSRLRKTPHRVKPTSG